MFEAITSYILQIFYAKSFSVENYGIFNTVNSFSIIFVFIGVPLNNFIIKYVSINKINRKKTKTFLSFYSTRFIFFIILLSLPLILVSLLLGFLLHIDFYFTFLAVLLFCIFTNISKGYISFLQGLQLFIQIKNIKNKRLLF